VEDAVEQRRRGHGLGWDELDFILHASREELRARYPETDEDRRERDAFARQIAENRERDRSIDA